MVMKTRKIELFDIINYIILTIACLIFLLPIVMVVSQSLMRSDDIVKYGYTLLPKTVTFDAYKYLLFKNHSMLRGFLNSVLITVVGTFLNLLVTSTFAYGLSKKKMPFRNALTTMVFITMIFNGGLIPSYLLITGIGLKNSYFALIVPVLINTWNMLILRNFFAQIPDSLEESADIDGANDFVIFTRIILPLSKASIATIGLFYAVEHWNSWFSASIYMTNQAKWPMQLLLREMLTALNTINEGGASFDDMAGILPKESVKSAAIVITLVPIMAVYPFLQKYFVKGVMVGSVKG
jgi:putative aldouronate transport system permease protein